MQKTQGAKRKRTIIILAVVLLPVLAVLAAWAFISVQNRLPDGFVYVTDIIPTAQLEIRYFGGDNFGLTAIRRPRQSSPKRRRRR